jgi:hypothetical protein
MIEPFTNEYIAQFEIIANVGSSVKKDFYHVAEYTALVKEMPKSVPLQRCPYVSAGQSLLIRLRATIGVPATANAVATFRQCSLGIMSRRIISTKLVPSTTLAQV